VQITASKRGACSIFMLASESAAFAVTWTNLSKERLRFRRGVPLTELPRAIPGILDFAATDRRNVIMRPDGDD
jgi:hypothetical protein